MTSQKTNLGIILIVLSLGIIIFALITNDNSCGIRHVILLNDLKKYEESLDPELCENLINTVNLFNEQCVPEIEIFDCS